MWALGTSPSRHERTRITVFPLIRSIGLKAEDIRETIRDQVSTDAKSKATGTDAT
jgi:hypothetical protein